MPRPTDAQTRPSGNHGSPTPPDPTPPTGPQPDQPPTTREGAARAGGPSPVQIWGRSLVIGILLGLFIGFAFGRGETARVIALMVVIAVIATVIIGGLITWLNRSRAVR